MVGRISASTGDRGRGDRGAAVVEMAMIGVILVLLLFGILAFGYLMGFRQNMVQAAAEGARRGATAIPNTNANAEAEAEAGARDAVQGFGQDCSGGMTCRATVAPCVNKASANCVTVTLTYDYKNHPLLPDVPIIGALMPDEIRTQSVAEVNP